MIDKINHYLQAGGLFNPELMEHEKVRDMVIEARDKIKELEAKLAEAERVTGEYKKSNEFLAEHADKSHEKLKVAVDALEDHRCFYEGYNDYKCPQCEALEKIKGQG